MAAPTYATDLNNIIEEMPNTTNWTLISSGGGGANSLTAPETDDFIQGTQCISRNPWTSANIRGMMYNSTQTIAADDSVFIWAKSDVTQALDNIAAGGLQVGIGSAIANLDFFYVDGSDTAVKGGWKAYAVDPTSTPSTSSGTATTVTAYFGFRWSVASSGPNKGFPYKIDAIRHGRSVTITEGASTSPASWPTLGAYSDDQTRRWGILQETDTGVTLMGIANWGSASTACYSRQTGGTVVFQDTLGFVTSSFTQVLINHASTDVAWTGVTFQALGTLNRGKFVMNATDDPVVVMDACNFLDIDTFAAEANTDLTDCLFDSCNEVAVKGGLVLGSQFLTPTVGTDSYALLWNSTADPDGELDNTVFSKGTNPHHAIEFIATTPTEITLRGIDFTGFSGTSTAAALNFLRTSGVTTVNLVGCTGTITAQVTGTHTVDFVIDPVTTTINVLDSDTKAVIQNAYVYLEATDGSGPLPFEDSVTVVRSGTTATVTHTAHGLLTGQKVLIEGTGAAHYFGIKTITYIGVNSYSYTTTASDADPTGVTSTGVLIAELTTAGGVADDLRSLSGDQPVTGWARKHTTSPYYKEGAISTTIDATNGKTVDVLLISDE
jgi:hypothetical protein